VDSFSSIHLSSFPSSVETLSVGRMSFNGVPLFFRRRNTGDRFWVFFVLVTLTKFPSLSEHFLDSSYTNSFDVIFLGQKDVFRG